VTAVSVAKAPSLCNATRKNADVQGSNPTTALKSAPEFREASSGRTSVTTKLYGLVALAVGTILLGPARAQAQTEVDAWQACMAFYGDEAVCGPQPPPPPPADDTTDDGGGTTDGGSSGGGTTDGGSTGGGSTGGGSLPPPQCSNGNHSGHAVASSGNANGHVCGGGGQRADRHGHGHKQKHGHRGHGYSAKAKAAFHKFASWCKSVAANHGRH